MTKKKKEAKKNEELGLQMGNLSLTLETKPKVVLTDEAKEYLSRLSTYGNDSSDEEDEVETYDIVGQVREYKTNVKDGLILPFVVHAVAIKFLYSESIQKKYYEKKREACANSFQVPDEEDISSSVVNSTNRVYSWNKKSLTQTKEEFLEKIFEIINGDITKFCKTKFSIENLLGFFQPFDEQDTLYLGDLVGWQGKELGTLKDKITLKEEYITKYDKDDCIDISASEPVDFFVKLRLHNRTDKRLEKAGVIFKKSDTWQYHDEALVEVNHGINLAKKNNTYRGEEVKFNSNTMSYPNIYKSENITLSDCDQLTKPFCKIEISELSQNAASLHYLLYGTEVVRNPSTLIHNMMAMELISNGKMSWKEAFDNRGIPMCIKGAIGASRMINEENSEYMPHKYIYDNYNMDDNYYKETYSNKQTLIKTEKDLVVKWLKLKFGDQYQQVCFNKDGLDLKITHAESMFDILSDACNNWYIGEKGIEVTGEIIA